MGALLTRPDLVEVYINTGIKYDLPVLMLNEIPPTIAREYPGLQGDSVPRLIAGLRERKLPVLDNVFQFYFGSDFDRRKRLYLDTLRNLKPGVTEIIIHCGYDDEELQAITTSNLIRDTDRRIFCDREVMEGVKKLDIEVITWEKFREMTEMPAKKG
jgi:hypothetical protein